MNNANEPARTGGFFVADLTAETQRKYEKTNENIREQADEAEQEAQTKVWIAAAAPRMM